MRVATDFSIAKLGIDATLVKVEADVFSGLPKTFIVELTEALVKECKK